MIDARGLSCPLPVVMVQKEVRKNAPGTLTVVVDNQVAVENIIRYANSQKYTVTVTEAGDDFTLTLKK